MGSFATINHKLVKVCGGKLQRLGKSDVKKSAFDSSFGITMWDYKCVSCGSEYKSSSSNDHKTDFCHNPVKGTK